MFLLDTNIISEIRKGNRRDSHQVDVLEHWLRTVSVRFADRILPVDERVADASGRMYGLRNVSAVDGLLAETAVVHDLTLVTRNSADVDGLGATVLNPFAGQRDPTDP